MRITKPLRLCLLYRPFRWRRQIGLSVCVIACLHKDGDRYQALPELTLLKDVLPTLDADEILDFIMPKAHPEFLVSGHAYTQHQEDKSACMVKVRVGDLHKEAVVFGPRVWTNGRPGKAEPFERQSLGWENSYGGAGFETNPLGRGIHHETIDGLQIATMPAQEHLQQRLHHHGEHVPPINFGPVPIDWTHRMQKAGTFDPEWIQNVGSGFFDDMDPTMFNAAQDDQIWHDRDHIKAGETFELWNLHPKHACWSGTVPDLRARCFIRRRDQEPDALEEITMQPTTLWFVPDQDNILMYFHGSIAIADDDAYDVVNIMPALEKANEPRTLDYYRKILAQRTDHDTAVLHAFRDEDLIPADMKAPWLENMSAEEQSEMLAKVSRSQYQGYGGDTAQDRYARFVGPIKPMTLGDLPELVQKAEWLQEQVVRESDAAKLEALQDLRENRHEAEAVIGTKTLDYLESLVDPDGTPEAKRHIPISGPPRYRNMKSGTAPVDHPTGEPDLRETAHEIVQAMDQSDMPDATAAMHKMYLYSVQHQQKAPRMSTVRQRRMRREVERRLARGIALSGLDLTGADLSGLDLSGQNLDRAWLESADLRHANMRGCHFHETVLANADLSYACLDEASLHTANLSETILYKTQARKACFNEVLLRSASQWEHCNFSQSRFDLFNASELHVVGCNFEGAYFDNCNFEQSHFEECRFSKATIIKGGYDRCILKNLEFEESSWRNTIVLGTQVEQVNLAGAHLQKTSWAMGTRMKDSDLPGAKLNQSSFREMDIINVTFSGALLQQCDFSLTHLVQCKMLNIRASQSLFVRTFFDGVDLSGSDLMQSNFQKALMKKTRLDKCNFFRADLSEIRVDETTRTDNIYLEGARMAPYHKSVRPSGGLA